MKRNLRLINSSWERRNSWERWSFLLCIYWLSRICKIQSWRQEISLVRHRGFRRLRILSWEISKYIIYYIATFLFLWLSLWCEIKVEIVFPIVPRIFIGRFEIPSDFIFLDFHTFCLFHFQKRKLGCFFEIWFFFRHLFRSFQIWVIIIIFRAINDFNLLRDDLCGNRFLVGVIPIRNVFIFFSSF